jgi:hypothetical protein
MLAKRRCPSANFFRLLGRALNLVIERMGYQSCKKSGGMNQWRCGIFEDLISSMPST